MLLVDVNKAPSQQLHPLWTELASQDGKKPFYYNAITGVLTLQRFTVDEGEFSDHIPGGILKYLDIIFIKMFSII